LNDDKCRSNSSNRTVSLTRWETGLHDFEEEDKGEEMTRKDYKLIAAYLNEMKDAPGFYKAYAMTFDRIVSNLCADLKQDNPNFDSAKFREKVYHG